MSDQTDASLPAEPIGRRLRGEASLRGVGLVTGCRAAVRISPGPVGGGVLFRRVDRRGRAAAVAPDWRYVGRPGRTTCLISKSGVKFHHAEHMLSALAAAGVADAVVEVDGPELPHLDGSAAPYCDLILAAGVAPMPAPTAIHILKPFEFRIAASYYRFEPASRLELDVNIELLHFGPLRWRGPVEWDDYRRNIAPARSFQRLHPWKSVLLAMAWLRNGCFLGVVVLFGKGVLNPGGLRMPDEMVRHRVVDVLGDLALAGAPIIGRVTAVNPSHAKTRAAVGAMMSTPSVWRHGSDGR